MYRIDRLDQNILNKSKTTLLATFYIIIQIFAVTSVQMYL